MNSVRNVAAKTRSSCRRLTLALLVLTGLGSVASAFAPLNLDPRVVPPLQKAISFLESQKEKLGGGAKSLAALALFKAGKPVTHPIVATLLEDIEERCQSGEYRPHSQKEGVYECGVELMLLQATEDGKYFPQIEAATQYLIKTQRADGSWTYPGNAVGDTSMSQYGILGFWAAELAGVDVPLDVWNRAIGWHVKTQMPDGGFSYHPGTRDGLEGGVSTHNLTNAGLGSLFVARMNLYPDKPRFGASGKSKNSKATKKFGVLEGIKREDAPQSLSEERAALQNPVSLAQIDNAIRRSMGWANNHFVLETPAVSKMYYYYTLERIGAFANTKTIGGQDWFTVCLNHLKKKQEANGSWKTFSGPANGTSFGILFMIKSTGKILKETVGGGLLTGGRGLPDDLAGADVTNGGVKEKRKIEGPLDELLTELSKLDPDSIGDAQAAIVEKVQLGNREELIGELDRIRSLIKHPNAEIRRTAAWALGRSGNLKDANLLISALQDNNVDVLVEAYNSLSYLSRKIDGVGLSPNPFDELGEEPSQAEKDSAVAIWRKQAIARWSVWYLRIRPYADRNDIFELGLGKKR